MRIEIGERNDLAGVLAVEARRGPGTAPP